MTDDLLLDQINLLDEINDNLTNLDNNLDDLLTYVIYQNNALNMTNDLIIACLNLLAGFVIGYVAVRGFFDPWT